MTTTGHLGMPDPNSSLWAWLAHDLRFYREKHGLSLAQPGKIIGHSRQHVSAMEHGRRRPSDQVAKILDARWDTGGHFSAYCDSPASTTTRTGSASTSNTKRRPPF